MNEFAAPSTAIKLNWHNVLIDVVHSIGPFVRLLVVVVVMMIVVFCPIPGRGPRMFQRRDPWRTFKYGVRAAVLRRAGGRREAPVFLCSADAGALPTRSTTSTRGSRSGATVLSNGQALCKAHNRHKGNFRPPWWYVLGLERRRRSYFSVGEPVRVQQLCLKGSGLSDCRRLRADVDGECEATRSDVPLVAIAMAVASAG